MSEPNQKNLLNEVPPVPKELVRENADKAQEEDPLAWLTPGERYAFVYFTEGHGGRLVGSQAAPISPAVAEGFLALYLQGRTLGEIQKLNPRFGLGQIVHAAVEGKWHDRRAFYVATATARAEARTTMALAEGMELAADMIAAIRRLHGDNIARYLQTGDPTLLGSSTSMATIRQLKEVVDLLQKMNGKGVTKSVGGTITHRHEVSGAVTSIPLGPVPPPPAGDAKTLSGLAAAARPKMEARLKGR